MQRDIDRLRTAAFDLLIVGGGVHGAALAFEAASRGVGVALIERGDFAGGASSNSLKILHGGFRYLQHANLLRMRNSIRARWEWSAMAPGLVRPLPCAIAAQGWGTRSFPVLASALAVNDLVSIDRNRHIPKSVCVPNGRMLMRDEFHAIAGPLVGGVGTSGCVWWDVLALDTEALVIGLIAGAAAAGACVANYVAATQLLVSSGAVHGVVATDMESGTTFELGAARTICAMGTSSTGLTDEVDRRRPWVNHSCWATNVVLNEKWHSEAALVLTAPSAARELFFVPWRDRTMIGTHYAECDDRHDEAGQRRKAVADLLELAGNAAPVRRVEESDVCFVHWGSLPLDLAWRPGTPLRLSAAPLLVDYGRQTGLTGLWSVTGVKFTTALEVARWALARVLPGLTMRSMAPIPARFGMLGSLTSDRSPADAESAGECAARDWLARRLEDAIFRRTGLGSAGYPGRETLEGCARGMARPLGWRPERIATEVRETMARYRERHFWQGRE